MSERVSVDFQHGPLRPADAASVESAGAVVVFEGVVRPLEGSRSLAALRYETYEPMTTRELWRLAEQTREAHGLLAIRVEHSFGRVAVGETSFRLTVASAHRAEALRAVGEFIDAMKRDVPLWKQPEFAEP